jgi:aryl-alcohol dehydrogenase-like predicted oxidoreductase
MTEANWTIVERLEAFCAARGRTMLELAFSWLLANPLVSSVIAGATRPEQLEQNVKAAQWTIGAEDLAEIERLTRKG